MKSILNSLGLKLLPVLTDLLISTLRIKISDPYKESKSNIYIFWHSQMIIGWWLFKNKRSSSLVSQSKDGEILSKLLVKWNYKVVRGSSSKNGKEAIQELIKLNTENNSVIITPDGPRGPAREMKNGIFIISNKCSIPVIPVKIVYHKKKILERSWDKFEIPLPFSKCEVTFGKKYYYEKYLTNDELIELKETISKEM